MLTVTPWGSHVLTSALWANLQEVDRRSCRGRGMVWRRTTDSHDSDEFSTLRFKIGPPLSEFTMTASLVTFMEEDTFFRLQ